MTTPSQAASFWAINCRKLFLKAFQRSVLEVEERPSGSLEDVDSVNEKDPLKEHRERSDFSLQSIGNALMKIV
jgi:hypothetical protein